MAKTTATKFKPLGDRVAIERIEEKTTSGIIIPDTAKEKPVQGVIIAAGEGARDEKWQLGGERRWPAAAAEADRHENPAGHDLDRSALHDEAFSA